MLLCLFLSPVLLWYVFEVSKKTCKIHLLKLWRRNPISQKTDSNFKHNLHHVTVCHFAKLTFFGEFNFLSKLSYKLWATTTTHTQGYNDEPVTKIIQGIEDSRVVKLDRWRLRVQKNENATSLLRQDDDEVSEVSARVFVTSPALLLVAMYNSTRESRTRAGVTILRQNLS